MPKDKYKLDLFNSTGQLTYSRIIDHLGGTGTQIILLPPALNSGTYTLRVSNGNNELKFTKYIILN